VKIVSTSATADTGTTSIEAVRHWHRELPGDHRIGLVPTMGALHEGHLSLIRRARAECDQVALTIFVNPAQFGPGEDLESYPRTVEQDLEAAREVGVDLVWIGDRQELYPDGFSTHIELPQLAQRLCGASRPHFFAGVCLIVLKLFHIFAPDRAYFGDKDYQQRVIIECMVRDLDLDLEVVACPLIREPDGLALSSRNVHLDPAAREQALTLSSALFAAEQQWRSGLDSAQKIRDRALMELSGEVELDYFEVVDRNDLSALEVIDPKLGAVACLAATVGGVRLIDNIQLEPR